MAAASVLSDADLHGLVDGHLDVDRRADVLRRAAASPRDRALVECWQDQADMIRAAFAGVEHDPIPSRLDLRTPPKLHALPRPAGAHTETKAIPAGAAVSTSSRAAAGRPTTVRAQAHPTGRSVRRRLATAATIAAVAVGLAGSWYVAGLPAEGVRAPTVPWSAAERQLADRTVAALAFGETGTPLPAAAAEPPTTTDIPDLSGSGFTFTGAEARGVAPRSLVFRYRNDRDERIAIGAVRTDADDSAPVPRDSGFAWRSGRVAYAIFGTVPSERLGVIAASLRGDAARE